MTNIFRVRRRNSSGASGAPSGLKGAELAFNEKDYILFYGYGDDGSGNATSIISIGGKGAFADLNSDQNIGGNKTFTNTPIVGTLTSTDNSTKAASTAFVKAQGYQTGNQNITLTGDVSGSGTTAITTTLATVNANVGTFTKVTVNAKGLVTAATTLTAADIPTLTAAKISDFDTQVRTSRLDQMAAPTVAVSYNNQKITNLANGTTSADAVNYSQLQALQNYVDSVKSGQDWKDSVRLIADSASDTLSGLGARDGITPVAGDRIGVPFATDATKRGIYIAASGAWVRSSDADNSVAGEVTNGLTFFVEEGNTYAGKQFLLTTPNPITLGTTNLTFVISNSGQIYSAGNGIGLSGTQFFVLAGTGLSQDADGLSISASYAGQTSITTLGTITTGTWQGTKVGLAYGGTNTDLTTFADGTLFKKVGTTLVAAIAGTDYLDTNSTLDGGTF